MKVMVKLVVSIKTPRSGVSGLVDDEVDGVGDEVGGIGGKVGGVDTSVHLYGECVEWMRIHSTFDDEKDLLAGCHGPECSRSKRVTGSYGRSTGIGDLVDTSREHGRSAVSMETMDSYGLTCEEGPGP
ncbi:uncharacterized protein UHOD_12305 [Ustilago sp. UG-2017b]|nr:uncharacterized protein UHOD_12305 [Ustilago sp. UG-2017b]